MQEINTLSYPIKTPPLTSLPSENFYGSKDSMFESDHITPIDPHKSFKNHFFRIHKNYKTLDTSNIENLVDKILNDKDSYFLNIVRDETQYRLFGIKTSLGRVLKELQNSQENPRRRLLTKNIFDKAEKEAKELLEKYFPDSVKKSKNVKTIEKINSFEKRRERIPTKLGLETVLNNYTTNIQTYSASAVLPNGDIIVVWQSNLQDGGGYGIFGRRLTQNLTKIGSEFQSNTFTNYSQSYPSIAALDNSQFVVSWESRNQDGWVDGVYAQVHNPDTSKYGNEFLVTAHVYRGQRQPSVINLGNNTFFIAYEDDSWQEEKYGIYGQAFYYNISKMGSEVHFNTYTSSDQTKPSNALLSNGNMVTVWESNGQDSSQSGIFGQISKPDGSKVSSELLINTYVTGNQECPVVAALDNDTFAVAWQSYGKDGDGYGISLQICNLDGSKIGSEIQVNSFWAGDQKFPDIARLNNNLFIVVWQSWNQDGEYNGIFGKIFYLNGIPASSEFQANTYWTNDQMLPSVAAITDSKFLITWSSYGPDGDGYGIVGQIFDFNFVSSTTTTSTTSTSVSSTSSTTSSFTSTSSTSTTSTTSSSTSISSTSSTSSSLTSSSSSSSSTSTISSSRSSTSSTSNTNGDYKTSSSMGSINSLSSTSNTNGDYKTSSFTNSITNPLSSVSNPSIDSTTSSTSLTSSTLFSKISSFFTKNYETTKNYEPIDSSKNNHNLIKIILVIATPIITCLGIGTAIFQRFKKRKHPIDLEKANKSLNSFESQISPKDSESSDSFEMIPTVKESYKEIGGKYYLLSKISKEKAEEIYEQTNYFIDFPDGEKKIRHTIGSGNFGKVKIALRKKNNEYVGAKKIKGSRNIKKSEKEANLQKMAAGENVLPIYNTTRTENAIYHFTPLAIADGICIQKNLSSLIDRKLAVKMLTYIAKDILTGLKTIHENQINHLDIKPDNLLFMKDGVGYINDFGCAKKSVDPQTKMIDGDSIYFSPNRLKTYKCATTFVEEKADLWAAGVSLLQIYKNISPFELFKLPKTFSEIVNKCDSDFFIEKINQIEELQNPEKGSIFWVIKSLLDPNPKNSFSETQALKASCFATLNKDSQKQVFERVQKEANLKDGKEESDNRENYPLTRDNKSFDPYGMNRDRKYYANKLNYQKTPEFYGKTPDNVVDVSNYEKTPQFYSKTPDVVADMSNYQKTPS